MCQVKEKNKPQKSEEDIVEKQKIIEQK